MARICMPYSSVCASSDTGERYTGPSGATIVAGTQGYPGAHSLERVPAPLGRTHVSAGYVIIAHAACSSSVHAATTGRICSKWSAEGCVA